MIWDSELEEWVGWDVFWERRAEPPDPTDDDYCRSLFDATTGVFFDA